MATRISVDGRAGELVFDLKRGRKIGQGDLGQETTNCESTTGKWPSCVPVQFREELPIGFNKTECICGKHICCSVKIPSDVWPTDWEERIRIIKIS